MKLMNGALILFFAFSSVSCMTADEDARAGAAQRPAAGAADRSGPGEAGAQAYPTFSEVDLNNNSFVDAVEAAKFPGIQIGPADVNYDGRLDRTEWERAFGRVPGPGPAAGQAGNRGTAGAGVAPGREGVGQGEPVGMLSFEEVDANDNGAIDAQEAARFPGVAIGPADVNYDGRVDRVEWERAFGQAPGR